jgi:hypothetical protein
MTASQENHELLPDEPGNIPDLEGPLLQERLTVIDDDPES